MRKPVVELVGRDLLLLAAVGSHAPDLHRAAALGVEINPAAIGGVVRAIVEAFCSREPRLPAAAGSNAVNVELAVAFGAIDERLSIGRPALPIGRTGVCDATRQAAPGGADINQPMTL